MGRTRRDVLAGGLSVGIATSLAGCLGGRIGASLDGIIQTPDPNAMEQDLGAGFDRLVWQEDGSAEIYFTDTHGMDGFYIAHESDRAEKAVASCDAPRYGGSITAPMLGLLQADGYNYPSRRFKLIAGEGTFSECSTWANVSNMALFDTYGTTHFTVPERFDL